MKHRLPLVSILIALLAPAAATEFVSLPGGEFRSMIRYEENAGNLRIPAFALMDRPVSRAQFQAFVQAHPQWRRDRVPTLFADAGYLADWQDAQTPGDAAQAGEPVTHVSWYAAQAYCRAQQARLPYWNEWEYAAAADAARQDARGDAAWRARLFNDGTPHALDADAAAPANVYGIHGLHGAYWEWTEDFSALLSGADKRAQDDGDRLRFCGATALAFNNRDNYAAVKRIALLSALEPRNTLGNLGFRCARSAP